LTIDFHGANEFANFHKHLATPSNEVVAVCILQIEREHDLALVCSRRVTKPILERHLLASK
jgi:hypothetical protein